MASETTRRFESLVQNGSPDSLTTSAHKNEEMDGKTKQNLRKLYRVYRAEESLVTSLRHNNPHFGTLINSGVHLMVSLCAFDIIKNSLDKGMFYLDFDAYFLVFGPFINYLRVLYVWGLIMAGVLAVHPMFQVWAHTRKAAPKTIDAVFILLYIAYNTVAHVSVIKYIVHIDLAPAPSLFLSIEQIRLTMKTYSFIRENAYKILWPWKEDDKSGPAVWYNGQLKPQVGTIGQYVYFLFSPTLLYRDNYPRTKGIRWRHVGQYFFEFISIIIIMVMILKNFVRPSLDMLPKEPGKYLIISCLVNGLTGSLYCFLSNGCVLHAWCNLGGELTCFADRHFYEDWWTCTDYQTFYRKWNYVVYDWIHAYFYRDIRSLFKNKAYRALAALPPIFISSLFHEYVIAVGMKFFFPVLTVMFFIFGGLVYFLRPKAGGQRLWNTLFLWGVSTGYGWMVWGYAIEYYARYYCPPENTFWAPFIPQVFTCFS